MSADTKSPTPEKPEPQRQIAPQTGELDDEQLDKVNGGGGGTTGSGHGPRGPHGPGG
jgi:hypothetical protein